MNLNELAYNKYNKAKEGFNQIKTSFDDLENALSKIEFNKTIELIITYKKYNFRFLLNLLPKEISDKIICFGSGALREDLINELSFKEQLEYVKYSCYDRNSWETNTSRIWYNDETRNLSTKNNILPGGWLIGTNDNWYLKDVKEILEKIFNFFNFNNRNILFYGSSMGGFTSIMLSILFKNTKCIADVPQLNLLSYSPFNNDNLKSGKTIKTFLFNNLNDKEIKEKYEYRLNVIKLMEKENYIPPIIINETLSYHDNIQIKQFFDDLKNAKLYENLENTNLIRINIIQTPKHSPLTYDDFIKQINEIFNLDLSYNYTLYT